MSSTTKKHQKNAPIFVHRLFVATCLLVIVFAGPFLFYNAYFIGKIFPNIYIAGVNVGGLTPQEAEVKLTTNSPQNINIDLVYLQKKHVLSSQAIGLNYDYRSSVERAYAFTRTGNLFLDSINRVKRSIYSTNLGLSTTVNEEILDSVLTQISAETSKPPIYPSVKKLANQVEVDKGTPGTEVDIVNLRYIIGNQLSLGVTKSINIPFTSIDPTISEEEALALKRKAEKYIGKTLSLKFESQIFEYKDEDILILLGPKGGYDNKQITALAQKIDNDIKREPQNPKFEFDGVRVTEFAPALDGVVLNRQSFIEILISHLTKLEGNSDKNVSFDLPVTVAKSEVATGDVNNFGIKEVLGRGSSTYFHSIPGRVFNVNLAATRINGTLIAPGETFSFNKTLGDVSKFTGYKEAYVILSGRTVLGDGGGVCQVSSTLFRSVLNAGLPIAERSAHAYRVSYYEQNSPPGLDATVFAPSPDFKFTNDTKNHILIQAKNDPASYSLVFEIYGTKDGRVAEISKPVVSNYSAPLPTIYQDDPTLPAGVLRQTDYAAAGARVSFNYSVKKDGIEVFQKTFVSNYRPWAAVFLRGTKI